VSRGAARVRAETFLPEPERLWIRFAPRSWPGAPLDDAGWLDLARGSLGSPGDPVVDVPLALPDGPFDDLVYLPPVRPALAAARDLAAAALAAPGTPVLVQLLPGEVAPEVPGVVPVHDLLGALLDGALDELGRLSAGAAVVWPLLGGLTDRPETMEEGCRRLAAAGVSVAQAAEPDLPPAQKRRLLERLEERGHGARAEAAFEALFHGAGPDPRAFARAAHRHGLAPFLPRPLPRPPLTGAGEREAAGLLALAGELHLRLGDEPRSQACFRAARFLDRTGYDVRALAREGNLPILHWLDSEPRRIIEDWAATSSSSAFTRLQAEYLA
jgi:hypothetical protein